MKVLSDLLTHTCRLVEAEVDRLRRNMMRTATSLVFICAACVVALMGVGLLLASAFMAIAYPLGPVIAALLVGGGTVALAVILLIFARLFGR